VRHLRRQALATVLEVHARRTAASGKKGPWSAFLFPIMHFAALPQRIMPLPRLPLSRSIKKHPFRIELVRNAG